MKIHYFQRYYQKENVATANTMLLLSRLYSYSSSKFFRVLKNYFPDDFEPELVITLQEKNHDSVPDATITQDGFKIVVETKLEDHFAPNQLVRHLSSFSDERIKVLLTLASKPMNDKTLQNFNKKLQNYNTEHSSYITHINTTFTALADAIKDVLEDRDDEMHDVLNDYIEYCEKEELITPSNTLMRMQLSTKTFDSNVKHNVYRDRATRGFRAHVYLGLYHNKSVRAIGKICARITALKRTDGTIDYETEFGELTEERKQIIDNALADDIANGYDSSNIRLRYFFVEKFYEMDFKKTSSGGAMGTKFFDLAQILGQPKLPCVEEIAKQLNQKTWE